VAAHAARWNDDAGCLAAPFDTMSIYELFASGRPLLRSPRTPLAIKTPTC
jgi:hypothetical protein